MWMIFFRKGSSITMDKRTWAEVDLDAIAHNIKDIRKNTPSYTEDICKLSEQGFFTGFTGIFETEAKILLEYKDQGVVMGYFLFDKSSKAGHYYLTTWNEKYTTLPFFNTIYAYKNVFVGYAQPRDLLELENLQDEKIRESIKDLEEDDNPCLILYELK